MSARPSSVDLSVFERIDHPGWHGCPGHMRHWFTMRAAQAGGNGVKTPRCTRCGFPKPGSDLTTDDWVALYELGWEGLTDAERAWIKDSLSEGWS